MYLIGVALLLFSLVLSGTHGVLQETILKRYGPHWQESIFYTVRHEYSIAILSSNSHLSFNNTTSAQHTFFVFLVPEVLAGFKISFTPLYIPDKGVHEPAIKALVILAVNLMSQSWCVGGVNRLTTVRVQSAFLIFGRSFLISGPVRKWHQCRQILCSLAGRLPRYAWAYGGSTRKVGIAGWRSVLRSCFVVAWCTASLAKVEETRTRWSMPTGMLIGMETGQQPRRRRKQIRPLSSLLYFSFFCLIVKATELTSSTFRLSLSESQSARYVSGLSSNCVSQASYDVHGWIGKRYASTQ